MSMFVNDSSLSREGSPPSPSPLKALHIDVIYTLLVWNMTE